MIKLVASDLDGTIIDNNFSIPKDNIKVINNLQKKHIPLVICTGKTYAISKDICQNLHASFGIFGNGSQIVDLTCGKEIAKKTLGFDEINACFSIIQKYDLHVHIYTDNGIVTSKPMYMDLRNFILFPNKFKFETVDSVFNHIHNKKESILKLIISSPFHLSKAKEELERIANVSINHIFKTGIYRDDIIDKEYEYLDISPINVTKGNALEFLTNYLHLNKNEILSIGDNLNDIDMLKFSNISAAVNNAHDQVKEFASYITNKSADNGGFAEAIYKFISF